MILPNPYNHPRGTICVLRVASGRLEALALFNQQSFREWNGCFSIV